jgi:N12 class adenine-specific DNA methylase/uncharacterized coiled-coil protein SlyX
LATKLQLITELSERTARSLTRSHANWISFLKTAAWSYKYPFQDQLLIYAQRPDATACAPIEVWNGKLGRWVNKGAKGIALIYDSGSRLRLRHVFDVSDTNSRYNRPVPLWEMRDKYAEAVTESLENTFGELDEKTNLPAALISAAKNAVDDNFTDYLSELMDYREDSVLEDVDVLDIEAVFEDTLKISVACMLLTRCGYHADKYLPLEDFQSVISFNTLNTISRLGAATSDIAEMLLREIEATVKDMQKAERKQSRTFAKSRGAAHNKSVKQSNERSGEHGTDLHAAGRLSDTRPGPAGRTNAHRQIWDVAQNIPEKPPERDVRQPDAVRGPEQPPGGDRPDGAGARRADHSSVPGKEPRAGQSERPAGLDGTHEQPQAPGGGNRTGGAYLQLTLLPTEEQQIEAIEQAEDEKSSAFSIPQEAIDAVLRQGIGVQDGKYRIYLHFQQNASAKENADFLKKEYGTGGRAPARPDLDIDEWHDAKGVTLSTGKRTGPKAKIFLSWMKVQKRIGELIAAGRYLSDKEKEYLPAYRRQIEERRQQLAEETYACEILNREPAPAEAKPPSRENAHYAFSLGSTVYIGADEYEVLAFDNSTVQLRDVSFPLFSKELARSDFERMLRENPLNDHLITGEAPEQPAEEKTEKPLPRALYREYLPQVIDRVRTDEIYPYLRDRDTDPDSAKRELDEALDRIALSMREEHQDFYEAYATLPQFREWLAEDVFQRTYQDYLTEPRELAAIHADDPAAPEWARQTGDTTVTPQDTVTIGSGGEGEPPTRKEDRSRPFYLFSMDKEAGTAVLQDLNSPQQLTVRLEALDIQGIARRMQGSFLNDDAALEYFQDFRIGIYPDTDIKQPAEKEISAGLELSIDGRRFAIDTIDEETGTVSLRDITFQNGVGFPIFRRESVGFVRRVLEQQTEPARQKSQSGEAAKASLHLAPEPAKQPRVNFRITDDNLGVGGQKTKYAWNVAAIRLVNQLEEENRLATPEEQEILSKYVGWGGLPQAFDEANPQWAKEYAELKELLDENEYNSARASTLNAHYTSPVVIKAIYTCLENMGFQTGNILEPACGSGNFFGLVPESMKESRLYGVELDGVTGRIAKQLYQQANIAVQGFEETNLPDSFFDLAVGNVPFGSYGVADKKYDKYKFYIHDYFFAKTLDKVRPGGIIAFITSKGTMDKQNPEVRKYIAQRAELLGAVRLPNNAFLANAGTEVTTDILFLQKRDRVMDVEPDWVHLSATGDGVPVNQYFADNPDMVLGRMVFDKSMYGNESETACLPHEDADLAKLLREALENIYAEISDYEIDDIGEDTDTSSIPADPSVRNFSYCLVDGQIYYRENSRMNRVETSVTAQGRIRGMIELRDCVRDLIEYQTEDYSDEAILQQQRKLNRLYDAFTAKYGLINSRGNSMAFADDSSYCLLCSLEVLDENGEMERKADMFSKRTIRQRATVTHVDTAAEALAISIAEKARVDLGFMHDLTGLSEEQLADDLQGVIFRDLGEQDPAKVPKAFFDITRCPFVTADEYLSGNVRNKLRLARGLAETRPDLAEQIAPNIKALEAVQPKDLSASEIDVRLGATWLPPDVVEQFMFELLEPPYYIKSKIHVSFSSYTAMWNVSGKNADSTNIKAAMTYGTNRVNAYKIIEETLNLKDVRIFDTRYDADGRETRVLNKKETAIAQQKQEAIKEAFRDWIWKDPQRRERLTRIYNDRFNAIRPREYDGSHIKFTGMNPEITLRKHQVDAVAHVLYGGNTLLAHCVGAGKTYEMAAAAMEGKHLGLCNKSLFVVPNHLTEQWAGEFLQLYPSANILVATKKDFETKNRKKFCARIATGDYDAVIIGHSQFEKIPISAERQKRLLQEQIWEITNGIRELKEERGERYAIKQLEKTKKTLKLKLDKLNDTSRKDDVVTFEELGVDRLFVDEADFYKNLFLYTKMRNVAGLSPTEAQKSSDLFAKCRYLDELTGGRGVIFATGTPISNSMTEMYTMQRYLQYETLRKNGLQHFDCWASTFGETVTAIELAPEGTGYRAKTRFARFYNLPELMAMFKEIADIKTADMLDLPVPKANYHNVAVKPSEFQRDMVAELSERAEKVRNRMVEPYEDNMLKITNDGRKLALDQRLMSPMLPDHEDSKVNACVENVFRLWQENSDKKLTQLVFCDLSTPKNDGNFNVYDDVRQKLTARGVPADEIAFIHDANTETRKKELFARVRAGQVRILVGSTFKMGAGTNVQDRLIALHDLDCPWRPRDLEQRSGRIVRQGNKNDEVHIFRYVTENTFDAYLYQILENKQRFISQIMTSKSPVRSAEDIDETALSYAEVKALATGNPLIKEKMDLDIQVSKLKLLKANHLSQRYALEDRLLKQFPRQIKSTEERIAGYEKDIARYERHSALPPAGGDAEESKFAGMTVKDISYPEKAKAGAAILEACKLMTSPEPQEMGSYLGFPMLFSFDSFNKKYQITLQGALSHTVALGADVHGNITRLNNALAEMPKKLAYCREQLKALLQQMETAKKEIDIPFEKEQELQSKSARLHELNILLNMDKAENEIMDDQPDEDLDISEKKAVGYER